MSQLYREVSHQVSRLHPGINYCWLMIVLSADAVSKALEESLNPEHVDIFYVILVAIFYFSVIISLFFTTQKGELSRAFFRINAHNRLEAYCKVDGVPTHVLISGVVAQNRAVAYKHQLELDEKKKKSLDKQLEFILGKTGSAQRLHDLGDESKLLPLWRQAETGIAELIALEMSKQLS